MKKFSFLLLIVLNISFAQSNLFKDTIAFPDCEDTISKESCFNKKTAAFINKNLKRKTVKKLIKASQKDTIEFYTKLYFDKLGQLIIDKSTLKTSVDFVSKDFKSILEKFPKILPRLDDVGNPGESYNVEVFGFKIEHKKLTPIDEYISKIEDFIPVDSQPIYKGCSETLPNENRINCLNYTFKKAIARKFNIGLSNTLNLPSGVITIATFFKINELGEIDDIRARSSRIELEEEAIRILKSLPNAIKPAMTNGKPKSVHFYIPIKFKVE